MIKKLFTLILSVFVIAIFIVLIAGVYKFNFTNSGDVVTTTPEKNIIAEIKTSDVKNMQYVINRETFTLINGTASKDITPGSATKNTLTIFGEPVYGDLNNDGVKDAAVLLVNNPGGSGSFYYAVLAIASGTSYRATNALILGDRIAPQTVEIRDGHAIYNYAERKATEPMTTQPSLGKSLFINYDLKTGEIGELVQNFEGEANPAVMSLTMKKWTWVKTQMNNGSTTIPKKTNAFTLTFTKDGHLSVTTDCNSMGGLYTEKGKSLTFSQMASTMMYCDGSQEQEFASTLNNIKSYLFTSKGELILEIKVDSGTMVFK
jgi:heat shock protein HslJ